MPTNHIAAAFMSATKRPPGSPGSMTTATARGTVSAKPATTTPLTPKRIVAAASAAIRYGTNGLDAPPVMNTWVTSEAPSYTAVQRLHRRRRGERQGRNASTTSAYAKSIGALIDTASVWPDVRSGQR